MRLKLMLIACGLLLLSIASAGATTLDDYIKCDHENGEEARCVDKLFCKDPETPEESYAYDEIDVNGGCSSLQYCCPEYQINLPLSLGAKPVGCGYGYQNPAVGTSFSSDYTYANYGEFPWMVALLKKDVNSTEFKDAYIGGGTLIDASVVLTVAHKVNEILASNLKIRAGEWDTTNDKEIYGHQERNVKKIIIHDDFQIINAHYDLALVILEQPFDINARHVGVACLETSLPPPGTRCYSMGWGEDFITGEKEYAQKLKKLTLPLVGSTMCNKQYRRTKLGPSYSLHKTLTCAGGESNVDTCIGDGGSSLVCPIPDKKHQRYSVVGMVVYGFNCGRNLPGVYANIPEAYAWVQSKMVSENITTMAFKKT